VGNFAAKAAASRPVRTATGATATLAAVVSPVPVVVESPRRLPRVVEAELARRREALLATVDGEVLDLDDPDARQELARAAGGRSIGRTYDVVVAVAQLVRFPDLAAALRGLDRLVAPTGRLLLVEPTGRPGLASTLLVTAWSRSPWTVGLHLGRDVPAALRATTLLLDDLERFTMPTLVTPLRHAVAVHAVRPAPTAAATGAAVRAASA
jgi:hypothetical protein